MALHGADCWECFDPDDVKPEAKSAFNGCSYALDLGNARWGFGGLEGGRGRGTGGGRELKGGEEGRRGGGVWERAGWRGGIHFQKIKVRL